MVDQDPIFSPSGSALNKQIVWLNKQRSQLEGEPGPIKYAEPKLYVSDRKVHNCYTTHTAPSQGPAPQKMTT